MADVVTFKDIFYLSVGTVIGLLAGVALYWLPLGQFLNEWRALWNLAHKRFNRGDKVKIRGGIDLKTIIPSYDLAVTHQLEMLVWHDEGVAWFHTASGWKRARVLQVFRSGDESQMLYRTCHQDIVS